MSKKFNMNENKKCKIQSSGYNGSEPTRECPNCREEKPLSDFRFRNMGEGKFIRLYNI